MRHDPVRVDEVGAWLRKVSVDIEACSRLLQGDAPLCDAAVFHAQQAAEKAIKGFLLWHDIPFGKTHNIVEIGKLAVKVDRTLENLFRRASSLTQYAWRFRYPGEPEEATSEEANKALALAKEVFNAVLERLPDELDVFRREP